MVWIFISETENLFFSQEVSNVSHVTSSYKLENKLRSSNKIFETWQQNLGFMMEIIPHIKAKLF